MSKIEKHPEGLYMLGMLMSGNFATPPQKMSDLRVRHKFTNGTTFIVDCSKVITSITADGLGDETKEMLDQYIHRQINDKIDVVQNLRMLKQQLNCHDSIQSFVATILK